MTPQEQEAVWEEKRLFYLKRLVDRVEAAMKLTSPTRRRALYEEWRKELGDDVARESAKFAEAALMRTVSLEKLKSMLK